MDRNNIQVRDKSDERKYFTIVPNIILDSAGDALVIALYMQLKRLAWDNGLAYPSRQYLIDRLKVNHATLKKAMVVLLEKGWITYEGTVPMRTAGGTQQMKAYSVTDIWKENVDAYQEENKGGTNGATPLSPGGINGAKKGVQTEPPNKMYSLNKIGPSFSKETQKRGNPVDSVDKSELTEEERRSKLRAIRENLNTNMGVPPLVTRSV